MTKARMHVVQPGENQLCPFRAQEFHAAKVGEDLAGSELGQP